MRLLQKINVKKYLLLSAVPTLVFCAFVWPNMNHIWGILIFYVLTLINQGILAYALVDILNPYPQPKFGFAKFKIPIIFVLKFAILVLALTLAIHFMEKNIFIPIVNYVLQIFILALSGKK